MSTSIDERVVQMKFDNQQFETNAKTTMSTLDRLKQALKLDGVSDGFKQVSDAAGGIKLDGIGSACETVSTKFSALQVAAVTALANITNDAVNAGKKIVSALTIDGAKSGFEEYELKMGSVQTIMSGTGESLSTVMTALEELNTYADKTIYSFSDMTSNIGKFTNSGVKLNDAVAAIQGVANVAAVSGANTEQASHAMYNFAQALSAGYVKLIDWKSIENANMATLEFKQQLLDTAEALGTVTKKGDDYITVTTNAKGTVSEAFDATKNFNDSLQYQWMTTEVLTQTLAKYSDEQTEIGAKATDAATKVKTFSMMMDTLKEAIGSGWAISFEKIVGDFDQASDIFTKITDKLSDVIGKQADSRNSFLDKAFNSQSVDVSKWHEIMLTAGEDYHLYQAKIMETARAHGIAIDKMIAESGSFENTLKSGWLNGEIFNEANKSIQKMASLPDGIGSKFSNLASTISDSSKAISTISKELNTVSGRTHVVNALFNVFEALEKVVKPVKEAFREIFPPKTGEDLRDALGAFEKFTEKLILSEGAAAKVKDVFKGLFNVLKVGLDTVKSVIQAFSPLKDIFGTIFVNLFDGAGKLGQFFQTFGEGTEEISGFQKVLNVIHDGLQTFSDNLQGYIDKIKEGWATLKDKFSESWDTGPLSVVANAIEKIKEALSGFSSGIASGFTQFIDTIRANKDEKGSGDFSIIETIGNFIEKLRPIGEAIKTVVTPIIQGIKDFFDEFSIIDTLAAGVKVGGIAGIASILGGFVDTVLDIKQQVGQILDPVGTLNTFVQQFGDAMEGLEQKVRVSVVKDFAICVGILAAAIYALASVDADGANRAVGIVSALVAEMVGVFAALQRMSSTSGENLGFFKRFGDIIQNSMDAAVMSKNATSVIKIAAAVFILAAALKMISDIDAPALWQSFAVISLLVGELTGVAAALSKMDGDMSKGSSSLIGLSIAVLILGKALENLSSLSWEEIGKGLTAVTILLGELVGALMILDNAKNAFGGGATMIAMSVALLILAGALKVYATMSWEDIAKGLVTVAGLLIELGVALTLMQASIAGAASLLIASAAILVLAAALKVMATIDSEKILPILGLLGGVLGELALGLTLMIAALPGAAALLVAAAALAVLAPVLVMLGNVPTEQINQALLSLAKIFGVVAVAGLLLGPISPLILAFAAALLVLSLAVVGIGAGLLAAGAGITALGVGLGLLSEISSEAAEKIVESLTIIATGLISLIPNMCTAFAEGVIQFCQVIVDNGSTIKEAIKTIVEIIIQVFTEAIPQIVEAAMQMLVSLMQSLSEHIPEIVDLFYSMIEGILTTFAEHIPEIIQAGVDIIVAFIEGIQSASNQIIDAAMEAVINFINGLAESISTHTPELIEAVNNLFHAVIDAMLLILSNGNPEFVTKAHEIMNSVKQGISDKVHEGVAAIKKFVGDLVDEIKNKVEDFKGAAKHVIDGFIQGIKDKIGTAKEAISEFGSNVVSSLKGILGIASPSKVARELGGYFGEGFTNGINDETSSVATASGSLAESATQSMTAAIDGMANVANQRAPEFEQYGEKIIQQFVLGLQNGSEMLMTSFTELMLRISNSITLDGTKIEISFKTVLDNMRKTTITYYTFFQTDADMLMNKFINGIKMKEWGVRIAWVQIIQSSLTTIRSYYDQFYSAGQYLVEGFINGINSKVSAAANAAASMAKAASDAARANLNINSPSKVFYEIGAYAGQGFINALSDSEKESAKKGAQLAFAAIKAAQEMIEEGIDAEPTITPVLDLTNVEEGAKRISSLMSRTQAMNVGAQFKNAETQAQNAAQTMTGSQQNINFTQNNYSPKALSRYEIYRQTNNQIAKMRGVLV